MDNRPRILLIDDETDIRELYKSFLEDLDYHIDESENGFEAFQLASKEQYNLYITDIMMPEMNGVEFIKVLKMIDPDAIVIIVTGYDDMEYTRQALEYGAFRYLTKPINMREFQSIVELGLIERKKLFNSSSAEKLSNLKEKLNNNPELHKNVFKKMQDFLIEIENEGSTYIEIGGKGANNKIWAKVKNTLVNLSGKRNFSQDEINIMVLSILNHLELQKLIEEKSLNQKFQITTEEKTYRYNLVIFFERSELVIGIKPFLSEIMPIDSLRITSKQLSFLTFNKEKRGLVIISGISGSGKTSFVNSIINYNNKNLSGSIQIIKRNHELIHESNKCLIRHVEIGSDVNSISEGLINALNVNPNLVFIENIVNFNDLVHVLNLIDSGTLVFTTMRTKSAIETIYRLFSLIPNDLQNQFKYRLTIVLKAIFSLNLIETTNGEMILAKDVLISNNSIVRLLLKDDYNEIYNLMLQDKEHGMFTLEQDVLNLVKKGLISIEKAIESVNDINQFKDMIRYKK